MKALYNSHNFYKKLKLKKTVKLSKFCVLYNRSVKNKQVKNIKLLNNHLRVKSIYKNYINFLKMQNMVTFQKEIWLSSLLKNGEILGFILNRKIFLSNFIKKISSVNYSKNKLLIYKFFSLKLKRLNSK